MNLYETGISINFCEVFQCYAFTQCQYLDEQTFSATLFSGV